MIYEYEMSDNHVRQMTDKNPLEKAVSYYIKRTLFFFFLILFMETVMTAFRRKKSPCNSMKKRTGNSFILRIPVLFVFLWRSPQQGLFFYIRSVSESIISSPAMRTVWGEGVHPVSPERSRTAKALPSAREYATFC